MLPSLLLMLLFIALPIIWVAYQSLFVEHEQVLRTVENCGPFGCEQELRVDTVAMQALNEAQPMGRFNGLQTYTNASHLALDEITAIWQSRGSLADAARQVLNLPLYKALSFTLSYTVIVTPLVIVLGFVIALAVNTLPLGFKGPIIFFSLLPMIVTPLIGSLILFWMIDARGIIGANLQLLFNNPELSLQTSLTVTWVSLFCYGVWHSTPLSFIIFYAALQTVPKDTLESAQVDGSSRWQRVRYIVIPHLMPVVVFVALVQLMDNFRVFEPIVGLSAEAHASSLSYQIYRDLRGHETPLFGSASATSMLTIFGILIILSPFLKQAWRDFQRKI